MNERMKALQDKVLADAYQKQQGMDWAMEKFAELIVRECANVALKQKKWVEDQVVCNPRDEEWNLARIQQSQRIVDKIKEHFGVEG